MKHEKNHNDGHSNDIHIKILRHQVQKKSGFYLVTEVHECAEQSDQLPLKYKNQNI